MDIYILVPLALFVALVVAAVWMGGAAIDSVERK